MLISLFIPFRCVAANIEDKESKIFRSGNLNQSIRASMSYPLYLEPITIDNKLLFDGGLYNNFPTDVMRDDFQPDVIIGCNVSSNEAPPREGDALSQLRNIVLSLARYTLLVLHGRWVMELCLAMAGSMKQYMNQLFIGEHDIRWLI